MQPRRSSLRSELQTADPGLDPPISGRLCDIQEIKGFAARFTEDKIRF